jgi:uncharacterized membrane protein YsdA (DUF1294 family)
LWAWLCDAFVLMMADFEVARHVEFGFAEKRLLLMGLYLRPAFGCIVLFL